MKLLIINYVGAYKTSAVLMKFNSCKYIGFKLKRNGI